MKQAITAAALLALLTASFAQAQTPVTPQACTDPGPPPPLFRTALSDEFDLPLLYEGEIYLDAVLIYLACSASAHDRRTIPAAELANRVRTHAARAFLATYANEIRLNGQLLETELPVR